MTINQEIDALQVMGVNPIRFLVVPSLVAMLIILPALVIWADLVSLLGAGLFISAELGMTLGIYIDQVLTLLQTGDVLNGLQKSLIFVSEKAFIFVGCSSCVIGKGKRPFSARTASSSSWIRFESSLI